MDAPPLPDWLAPALPHREHRGKAVRELEKTQFALAFDLVIEEMTKGRFLSSAVRVYPIDIDYGRFLAWIKRDKDRWGKYCEAQQCGGEMIMAQLMDPEIEDARVIPDDPQMATVRFNKTKWYLGVIDRRRFGPSTQVSGDPDQPIEHRVVHSIARSPLDDLPAERVIEHSPIEDAREPWNNTANSEG